MYTQKLKTFSFILMAVGLLGIWFFNCTKDIQEVENYLLLKAHGHGKLNMRKPQLPLQPGMKSLEIRWWRVRKQV
jgi:hypothetical protein